MFYDFEENQYLPCGKQWIREGNRIKEQESVHKAQDLFKEVYPDEEFRIVYIEQEDDFIGKKKSYPRLCLGNV